MIVLYITVILLQLGVIVYFVRRGRKQKNQFKNTSVPDTVTYDGLRNVALHITPAQLKLSIPDNETFVYGVIMDCNIGDAIVTLSAYITGAVSICFSNGGVKTGGGMYPEVAELAVGFVTGAQDYIDRVIQVTTTELPSKGCARFYLLTNHGIFVAQEQLIRFERSESSWLPLFEKGNEIISQMHSSGNGNLG